MAKRRTYDKEIRREAVRLVVEEGRKASEVENNLGICSIFYFDGIGNDTDKRETNEMSILMLKRRLFYCRK